MSCTTPYKQLRCPHRVRRSSLKGTNEPYSEFAYVIQPEDSLELGH